LNENPQFALEIDRPTDLCITMSQTDKGLADSDPLEAMFFLYKPPKPIGLNEAPTVRLIVWVVLVVQSVWLRVFFAFFSLSFFRSHLHFFFSFFSLVVHSCSKT
jgi:hypothetical protein